MLRDPRLGKLPKCPRQRPPTAGHTKGTDMTDTLKAGDELSLGGVLTSTTTRFTTSCRPNGKLVQFRASGGDALWASNSMGTVADRAVRQEDGNFVLYSV
jgi:hypothetical protein